MFWRRRGADGVPIAIVVLSLRMDFRGRNDRQGSAFFNILS